MHKITTLCAVAALAAGAATGAFAQSSPRTGGETSGSAASSPSGSASSSASGSTSSSASGSTRTAPTAGSTSSSTRTGPTAGSTSTRPDADDRSVSGAAAGSATRETSTACKNDTSAKACAPGQEKKREGSTSARPYAPGQEKDAGAPPTGAASGGERQ